MLDQRWVNLGSTLCVRWMVIKGIKKSKQRKDSMFKCIKKSLMECLNSIYCKDFFSFMFYIITLFCFRSSQLYFFHVFVCLSVVKSDDVHVLIPFSSQLLLPKPVVRLVLIMAITVFLYLLLRIS